MGYHIEFSDITKYKGDAIVNSLGVNGSVYGRLCKNIIEAANSPELTDFVNNKLDNKIGDMFLTGSGELPCKKIIHVVTPFKHMDDASNTLLKNAYRKIIDTALIQGYTTLGLPFIGTGANGYSDTESYDAITSACEYLMDYEEKLDDSVLDVTIIGYLNESSILSKGFIKEYEMNLKRNNRLYNEMPEDVEETCSYNMICQAPGPEQPMIKEIEKCLNPFIHFDPYDGIVMREKGYKYPYDFIKDFLKQKGKSDKIFKKFGISPDAKYKLSIRQSFQKKTIYKLAFMCDMSLNELIQFMLVCEASFSPYNKLDLFMIKYLTNHMYKCSNPYDFASLVKKYAKVEIFSNID